MIKYFILFLIIISIIFFFIYNFNYLYDINININKNKIFVEDFITNIPNTSNISETSNIMYNNLIDNGSFINGSNPKNYINHNGYNKIIVKKNPGKSSYVLEQKKTNNLTYYELLTTVEQNSKYILYFWLCIEDSDKDISVLDFNRLIKIKIENSDFTNYLPSLNYNIVQSTHMKNTNDTWYLLKYDFMTGPSIKNKMQLYFNYSENIQYNIFYIADISLYRVLLDAENFIYNDNLLCYVDGFNYQGNTPTWHDLSGNGNDLFWSNIPMTDTTKGMLTIANNKLTGFPANRLSNKDITIIFLINKNFEDETISSIDILSNEYYLISIPGNSRYSFEVKLGKDNYLYVITDKETHKSKNELLIYNKSQITIDYSKEKEVLNIYLDGFNILSINNLKLFFSESNIIINRNNNLNYNLYSILFYNRIVPIQELNDIREYFITSKNKSFRTPDINNYHMNSDNINFQNTFTNDELSLQNIQSYTKKMNEPSNNVNFEKNIFIDKFDNINGKIVNECFNDCHEFCENYLINNDKDKYECLKTCKNTVLSCKTICEEESFENSLYCSKDKNFYDKPSKECIKSVDSEDNILCPKVYIKNKKYMVYLPPNSYYAKKLKYSGEKSYGYNREKAKQIYTLNFPKCPIPPMLQPGNGKSFLESCPFVVNDGNPCYTHSCAGIDWNVKHYQDLGLTENCKKTISNYCQINYDLDDKCICWNPEYKDDPKCISFRRYFENPNDYCSPNQFKINEHPEFSKYIKKDEIPCWGCNITD